MIVYTEIKTTLTDPELSQGERIAMKQLEKLTDAAINEFIPKQKTVYIDAEVVDKVLENFGVWRKPILIEHWRKMYESNGWNVWYNGEDNCYLMKGLD